MKPNHPKQKEKCKHGVKYAFDEYGNGWTTCVFCKPNHPEPVAEWEKEFDKQIGMIEGYKLCITYEDQQDQNVEYQVKSFIRKLLLGAKQEERDRIKNYLLGKAILVTYKKDGGHGLAVPNAYIIDLSVINSAKK